MKSHLHHFPLGRITLLIATGVTLLFTSCQKDEGAVGNQVTLKSSTLLENTGYVTFYEKELFVRMEGKPVAMTRQIGNSSISNFEPCFLVYIQSGYDNANYVSSAVVKIDGIELLNTSDFSNTNSLYQFELCNLTETSTIELVIMGAPGSTLEVWIEGKPRIVFNPNLLYGSLKDIDGNIYKTIQIGTQTWMAENLRVTKFNDGTQLPMVTEDLAWDVHTNPAYCWYDNDISYKNTYGALYNSYVVTSNNICPEGWHIPTYSEWDILGDYLGGFRIAAAKMREIGTIHWDAQNDAVTNESGFTALPAGYRATYFYNIRAFTFWWSSTVHPYQNYPNPIWARGIQWDSMNLVYLPLGSTLGLSVRCIKD